MRSIGIYGNATERELHSRTITQLFERYVSQFAFVIQAGKRHVLEYVWRCFFLLNSSLRMFVVRDEKRLYNDFDVTCRCFNNPFHYRDSARCRIFCQHRRYTCVHTSIVTEARLSQVQIRFALVVHPTHCLRRVTARCSIVKRYFYDSPPLHLPLCARWRIGRNGVAKFTDLFAHFRRLSCSLSFVLILYTERL